jgi:beta-glucosidase
VTGEELARAAEAARGARVAVVVAGLPDSYESEGFDRDTMQMPEGHNRLIEAVAGANPETVVVLLGGSPMELPWCDKVKAILYMGLPGQAGGRACAALLTGRENPGGKLTESWPMSYGDVVSRETFGKKNTEYRESLYVGYRYYDKAKKRVRFPFGHGLSYTSFAYSGLRLEGRKVSAVITNTGNVAGDEVVQLYVAPPAGGIFRPEKELKGFARVALEPGEAVRVEFLLDERSFAVWSGAWKVPGGTYGIWLASSSSDIRLKGEIAVPGEEVAAPKWQAGSWYETMRGEPKREEWEAVMGHAVAVRPEAKKGSYTLDNTCLEMRESSAVMRLQYRITELMMSRHFGWKRDYGDPAFRMMMACATDCPLRAAVISSGGALSYRMARGLLSMANGHFLRGLALMLGLCR